MCEISVYKGLKQDIFSGVHVMLHSVKRQTQTPQIHHEHMETAALQRDHFAAVWW